MSVERSRFGVLEDGAPVDVFALRAGVVEAKVINYGATLMELWVPGRDGKPGDIVLGFDNLKAYLGKHPHFGGIVGRFANRIAKGRFSLDGKEYQLAINNPPNSLHGGIHGFDRALWKAVPLSDPPAAVRLEYVSADGEEGFPGKLSVAVTYLLTGGGSAKNEIELKIDYEARTDRATPVNLTNHSYFNFRGSGDILGHVIQLDADSYTPVDATLIPTGEIKLVAGKPLDFRKPAAIGARIGEVRGNPGGYDHNFVVNGAPGTLRRAARVTDPDSGREMEVWTTQPGVQFYSGNFLDGSTIGKNGFVHAKHTGFCLETQHYPDAMNHPNFPPVILRPDEVFRQTTAFRFSAG